MQHTLPGASKATPLRAVWAPGRQVIELTQGTPFPVNPIGVEHAYFVLRGDFDVFNRPQLSAALGAAAHSPLMTIDLQEVSFMDAGVLGVLAGIAAARLRSQAAPLRILNAHARLKRLFVVCRLQSSFRFEEDGT